jgi:ketosteroid isomerase-like protein
MSQENVEIVRTLLSAYDRADYEAALEALDPEIEWQVPPGIAIGREVYRGRDEVQWGLPSGSEHGIRTDLSPRKCSTTETTWS